MANVVGVVGSSRRLEKQVDFLGRTPSEENNWDLTMLSDMAKTKAMFISIDGVTFNKGVALEEHRKKIEKGEWEFPTYFLMPDNVLLKRNLHLNELWEVRKNLSDRNVDFHTYVCGGKPFIPAGDISSFVMVGRVGFEPTRASVD